jgi:methanethiol S-methyltransferase
MLRTLLLLYSTLTYLAFFATFLWAIGFVGCVGVSKCVDTGTAAPTSRAILMDALLLGAFAVQHSIMARRWFKQWWTRIIPRAAERSTYVLTATALLALVLWQWRPMPGIVWNVQGATARTAFWSLYATGWLVVLAGTFMIDHFDLFGLRQGWLAFRGREYTHPPFTTAVFYRYTRNPLMLGFIVAFWAAPTLTVGRLFFAFMATAYILVGIALEERDHAYWLGSQYLDYKARTSMLIPLPPRPASQRHAAGGDLAE